jgi:hypothetical protein
VWQGQQLDKSVREATIHHSIDGSFSIRMGKWKLEMCAGSGGWSHPRPDEVHTGLPPMQLYDLEADIGERNNIIADHPELVDSMKQLLTHYVENGRSTPGEKQPNTGASKWQQLWWM